MKMKNKKAMTRRMIMRNEMGEKKLENLNLEEIFKFLLTNSCFLNNH